MQHVSHTPSARAAKVPFFGLGLDLGKLLDKAVDMRLTTPPEAMGRSLPLPMVVQAFGYELQVLLGRDIRAG